MWCFGRKEEEEEFVLAEHKFAYIVRIRCAALGDRKDWTDVVVGRIWTTSLAKASSIMWHMHGFTLAR